MSTWKTAYDSRTDLAKYSDNSLGLFALALNYGIDDLDTVAAESITDGGDDKKCDIIYINKDEQLAVVCQCYISSKYKDKAPANKASDLNTAIGWLLHRPLKDLPERILPSAKEIREGILAGEICNINIWYIHNLPESKNVHDELLTVEATAKAAIETSFNGIKVRISTLEVGDSTLEEWYTSSQTPVLVNDKLSLVVNGGFEQSGPDWDSFITAVPGTFLHKIYKKYKTRLFSANVRDYLGSRSSDSNINNGIKRTIEKEPANFWVFNNGLTLLVNDYSFEHKKDKIYLEITGISIVNGAQTTGAIGSLSKTPDKASWVPARFVKTKKADLIHDIIRYNNSQNKVTASDFRSTDKIQKRLREEIDKIPNSEYEGGRRGGHGDAIRRRPNLLPSYTVGQALTAFHGDPITAYNQKSNIWIDDNLYSRIFNESTTARHIVCVYALLRAIENKKVDLVNKSKKSSLTAVEDNELNYFRKKGSLYLFSYAVSACLESIIGKKIPNAFRISFGEKISPKQAEVIWSKIIEVIMPFCTHLEEALNDGLKSNEKVNKAVITFQSLVQVTAAANKEIYSDLARKIITK